MIKLALLANPDSGSGAADDVEELLRARGADVERFGLDEVGAAIESAPGRLVVAGGDGSIGCAASAAAEAGVPLAVVAVGTANDFARALALPEDLESACQLAVAGGRTRRLELGRMNDRPFVNVASAGLPPAAARRAHGLKAVLGPLAYAVGALRAALTAKPIDCRVSCDGEQIFAGEAWQVTVACTGAFGGGSAVEADPSDGLLDAVVLEAGTRLALVARGYGLRRGRVERQRGVRTCRGREVTVSVAGDELASGFNVDGEVVERDSARFTVDPAAFEVVVG